MCAKLKHRQPISILRKIQLVTLRANSVQQSETLNLDISDTEIENEIKSLKSRKSFYLDDISNESLKSGYEALKRPLKHLFNTIYQKGSFPGIWRDGFIVPIHKKTDILDVNNYRGIIISSCIGKFFLKKTDSG